MRGLCGIRHLVRAFSPRDVGAWGPGALPQARVARAVGPQVLLGGWSDTSRIRRGTTVGVDSRRRCAGFLRSIMWRSMSGMCGVGVCVGLGDYESGLQPSV